MSASNSDRDARPANSNWRRFVWYRVFFNARFCFLVLAVSFWIWAERVQYTLLNFAWTLAIVAVNLTAGVLTDRVGHSSED